MNQRLRSWIDPYLLLLWALSVPALAILLAPGYFFAAHDGQHSVFYQIMFDASLRSGAWWPRWAMHHIQGYGYPTFIIQAPLGFYLAEIFVLLGAGFTLAAKLTWAVGFLMSGWGMQRLVLHWLRPMSEPASGRDVDPARLAALVAGLLYVYIPYHLAEMVVRGALNDSLLMAWFPWVFLAFDRLIDQGWAHGWQRRLAWAILTLAGLLLTHSFALVSFAPLVVVFVLFRLGLVIWRTRQTAGDMRRLWATAGLALAAGVGALLLSMAFVLPLLTEGPLLQQHVYVTNSYDYRNNFVFLGQFFSPYWGFGFSDDPAGANDGMGFQLGMLALMIGITSLWLLRQPGRQRALMVFLALAALGLILMMTPWSRAVWAAVPPLAVIQFPWRLLALADFVLCALAGLAMWQLSAQNTQLTGALLVVGVAAVLASASYSDAPLQPVEPWREDGRAIFRFEREHPDMIAFTSWVKEPFTESPMTAEYAAETYSETHGYTTSLTRLTVLKGDGVVQSNYSFGSRFGGVVELQSAGVVRINLFHFPGWQVMLDGQPVLVRVSDPYGLLEIDAPAGRHNIDVQMGSTPARRSGALLSWCTLLVVAGLLAWPRQ